MEAPTLFDFIDCAMDDRSEVGGTPERHTGRDFVVPRQDLFEAVRDVLRVEWERRVPLTVGITETKRWNEAIVVKRFQSAANNADHNLVGIRSVMHDGVQRLPIEGFLPRPGVR